MGEATAEIINQGLDQLRELLGQAWDVAVPQVATQEGWGAVANPPQSGADMVVRIGNRGAGGYSAEVLVDAATKLTPAEARRILAPQLAVMERLRGHSAALVIAPWLSPRTRSILDERGCGYLDFTGNVSLRLSQVGIFIRLNGAQQAPSGLTTQGRTLGGARAGRLVRILVDTAPPYRPTELAGASRLSLGYASRLLDIMADENLIGRRGRLVTDVDWIGLVRARAAATSLLGPRRRGELRWMPMLAPKGPQSVLRRLANLKPQGFAITGSVATSEVAPVAVGGQLMIYFDVHMNRDEVGRQLGLMPSEHGADVVLIEAPDMVVFAGTRLLDNVPHVALSQLAIDCLSGPGRLPAEGEAVLSKMIEQESSWRLRSLNAFELPNIA